MKLPAIGTKGLTGFIWDDVSQMDWPMHFSAPLRITTSDGLPLGFCPLLRHNKVRRDESAIGAFGFRVYVELTDQVENPYTGRDGEKE
jgi:hypothetical protein